MSASFQIAGNELFKIGEHKAALVKYSKAIALNPREVVYYSNRCATHLATKDPGVSAVFAMVWIMCPIRLNVAAVEVPRAWRRTGVRRSQPQLGEGAVQAPCPLLSRWT